MSGNEIEQPDGSGQTAAPAAPAGSGHWAGKIFWGMAAFAVAGLFLYFAFAGLVSPVNAATQQNSVAQPTFGKAQASPAEVKNGVQEVTLTVQGGSYMPNPIRVKKGVPVRITADLASVRGCARSMVIPDFGVRKTFGQGDASVEFTPDKSGTFDFGCSMWMYRGKMVVEEADGTVAAATGSASAASLAATGACKMGGGGGCGSADESEK